MRVYPGSGLFFSLGSVILYALFVRLTFGAQELDDYLGIITLAFIFVVPFVLGILTMALVPRRYKTSVWQAIFIPWLTSILVAGVLLILAWELLICIIMALPIYLPLSSLGGFLYYMLVQRWWRSKSQSWLLLLILTPYFAAAAEQQLPSPQSIRTVDSQIVIEASPDIVWQQITSVAAIQPAEHYPAMFHQLGLPRPIQAMLAQGQPGAVRQSSYEGGLFFEEVVTRWQPQQGYSFTIDLAPNLTPPWPWSQIDGPHFQLLDGVYMIESLDEQRVILHLSSRHRLGTKFNSYAGLWTDFLLGDIQRYILTIVKTRAEESTAGIHQDR